MTGMRPLSGLFLLAILALLRSTPADHIRTLPGGDLATAGITQTRGRLVAAVRELRDFLYPNGWQRGRDWPKVREALQRAHNYTIPGRFPWRFDGETRYVNGWVPFRLIGGAGEGAGRDKMSRGRTCPASRWSHGGTLPPTAGAAG